MRGSTKVVQPSSEKLNLSPERKSPLIESETQDFKLSVLPSANDIDFTEPSVKIGLKTKATKSEVKR